MQNSVQAPIKVGAIEAIFRYPVKSMRGEQLEIADLGWDGIDGDRRLAFRRIGEHGGYPFLTAGRVPDLLLFTPQHRNGRAELPTHVCTPEGKEMPIFGQDLAEEVGRRHGAPVEMMQLKHGIFDEACISVISLDTVCEVSRLTEQGLEARQFRPNLVIRCLRPIPFQENEWVDGLLTFGEQDSAPAVNVTMRDVRCGMLNLDPDSARSSPEVLKAVVRANENTAGIYATVTRIGRLEAGQAVFLQRAASNERKST